MTASSAPSQAEYLCVPCARWLPEEKLNALVRAEGSGTCAVCHEPRPRVFTVDRATVELISWDPPFAEREYYRDAVTGRRGWKVKREGAEAVRFEQGTGVDVWRPMSHEFQPDGDTRPLSVGQLANVAFDADRSLCRFIGMHDLARKGWMEITDEQRKLWIETGPTKDPVRRALWKAINDGLGGMAK